MDEFVGESEGKGRRIARVRVRVSLARLQAWVYGVWGFFASLNLRGQSGLIEWLAAGFEWNETNWEGWDGQRRRSFSSSLLHFAHVL